MTEGHVTPVSPPSHRCRLDLCGTRLFCGRSKDVSFCACGSRTDGGIAKGSTVGMLLDFSRRILIFLINDEQQGPVAFEGLEGAFYPAVSLNRNVQVKTRPPPIVFIICISAG